MSVDTIISIQSSINKLFIIVGGPDVEGRYLSDLLMKGYCASSSNCLRHVKRKYSDIADIGRFSPKLKSINK